MSQGRPVVLAAGGTGGHMFPAVALGEALLARGHRVLFATDPRGAQYVEKLDGAEAHLIPSASPSRGGVLGKATFMFTLSRGAWASTRLLRKTHAKLAVGFGGYASFPTCFMAVRQGLPVVLHEQNGYLGLANRKLAERVSAIATSFPDVKAIPSGVDVAETGNPVREEFISLHGRHYAEPDLGGEIQVLTLGGSQGARIFSDVVPEAMARLEPQERSRFKVTQQCREEDLERTEAAFEKLGMQVELKSFFDNVPALAGKSHLMICRAGAGTVSEALVAGLPAIYVPYPHAADNHQFYNAEQVAEQGAGWLMPQDEFTPEALAGQLRLLAAAPKHLTNAAHAAARIAKPDAASRLADLIEKVLESQGGPRTS